MQRLLNNVSGAFIDDSEHILHLFPMFLLLHLSRYLFICWYARQTFLTFKENEFFDHCNFYFFHKNIGQKIKCMFFFRILFFCVLFQIQVNLIKFVLFILKMIWHRSFIHQTTVKILFKILKTKNCWKSESLKFESLESSESLVS